MASDICLDCINKVRSKFGSYMKKPQKKGVCLFCGAKGRVFASNAPYWWVVDKLDRVRAEEEVVSEPSNRKKLEVVPEPRPEKEEENAGDVRQVRPKRRTSTASKRTKQGTRSRKG